MNRITAKVLTFSLCVFLAACATKYQEKGFGGGYTDIRLNSDTFQISVSGNGYTSKERAQNIAMLRAAELTIQNGGERFIVLSGRIESEYSGSTPIVANRVGGTVIVSGGDSVFKPGGDLTIRIVKQGDPNYANALDARLIDSQIRPRLS